jgi:hypothetical protein
VNAGAPLPRPLLITCGLLEDRVQGLGAYQGDREEEKEPPAGARAVGADEHGSPTSSAEHGRIVEDPP